MRKNILNSGIIILAVCLSMIACRKDSDPVTKEIIIDPPVTLVESSLIGQVIDEDGTPLSGILINNGTNSAETDENGVFNFTNVMMNSFGQLVTANADGYFLGAKMVEARLNSQHYTQFTLMKKQVSGEFSALQGASILTNDGVRLEFPENAIEDQNGNPYNGDVRVYARFIDPGSETLLQIMPGDLRAVNENSDFVQLETYGMIAVELEGPAGNKLNLSEGSEADIELPLDASLAAIAPDKIPLWHFDEESGYWVQEGEAILNGNKYEGKVSHFSFWNCDYPYPLVQLEGTVVDEDGNGLQFLTVQASLTNGNSVGYSVTDANGDFGGKVPANEEMTISVFEWNCGASNVLYEAVVGPFSTDTNLGSLTVNSDELVSPLQITATLLDCNMDPVTNGYLKIESNGIQIIPVSDNGLIEGTIYSCDATSIDVTGYDIDELKKSNTTTHDIDGLSSLDLGNIDVCDADITEYIEYTIDDGTNQNTYLIADPECGFDSPIFVLSGNGIDSNFVSLQLEGEVVGEYNPIWANFSDPFNPNGFGAFCQGCPDFYVTLSEIGEVGEAVSGSFYGDMQGSGATVSVTGSFVAIREY